MTFGDRTALLAVGFVLFTVLVSEVFYVVGGIKYKNGKCTSTEMKDCKDATPVNIMERQVIPDACCQYSTPTKVTDPFCIISGCYQAQATMQIVPLPGPPDPPQSCFLSLSTPVGTYGEANATVTQFENKTWFVNLGSPPSICTLAANDYPKKRTGFILMMVATGLWCLVGIGLFSALCYYCFKRCPCRIRIERVEKVVPLTLTSSTDDL
jgi:hypothetical protein